MFVGGGVAAATIGPQVAYFPASAVPVFSTMATAFRRHCVWSGIALPTIGHVVGSVVKVRCLVVGVHCKLGLTTAPPLLTAPHAMARAW